MVSGNQAIGTSVPEKVDEGGAHVSYQWGPWNREGVKILKRGWVDTMEDTMNYFL